VNFLEIVSLLLLLLLFGGLTVNPNGVGEKRLMRVVNKILCKGLTVV
jgi:hypothetical protein